jgi:hypothetical protein
MTVDRSYRGQSTTNEHKMIDIQYEIQKIEADLEFHTQKIRLIKHTIGEKNEKLSVVMRRVAYLRRIRERFTGERNEN